MVATLAGLLYGAVLLFILLGGTCALAAALLAPRVRARRERRHPERAAGRHRTRYERQVVADWPLLAQTLRLGYTDLWTRQHAYPRPGSWSTTRA
jgi:hypothetical protein